MRKTHRIAEAAGECWGGAETAGAGGELRGLGSLIGSGGEWSSMSHLHQPSWSWSPEQAPWWSPRVFTLLVF